jgi:hypothetical protein
LLRKLILSMCITMHILKIFKTNILNVIKNQSLLITHFS